MAKLNLNLKNVEAKQTPNYSALPKGTYTVVVSSADVKETKSGGHALNVAYKVAAGEHEGRLVFDFLNIQNKSPEAQRIAHERLKTIMWSTGLDGDTLEDSDDLLGKEPFDIIVAVEEYEGREQNRVKAVICTRSLEAKKEPAKKSAPWKK